MGTPRFAVPSLDILLSHGYDVVSVVTVPDKKKGRGQQVAFSDVKTCALSKNLPVLQPASLKDEQFRQQLEELKPDLIVVVAFRILPSSIYTIPKHGSINVHASLLPKYRGAAPINWAIMNGEKETGVTTFFLQDKVDTGNIILQSKTPIGNEETYGELYERLSIIGADALIETVRKIETGAARPLQQDESLASPAPKIFKDDCLISWNRPAEKIFNFIRGLSPQPAAFTFLNSKSIKILKVRVIPEKPASLPAEIEIQNKKLFVSASDHFLEILELQPEGKKKMDAASFLNGIDKSKAGFFSDVFDQPTE
jgi:methionyl-tRNA formyltransferase